MSLALTCANLFFSLASLSKLRWVKVDIKHSWIYNSSNQQVQNSVFISSGY